MRHEQPNKLKTIDLSSRKIERDRVAVVNFGVNERTSNRRSSSPANCTAKHDLKIEKM